MHRTLFLAALVAAGPALAQETPADVPVDPTDAPAGEAAPEALAVDEAPQAADDVPAPAAADDAPADLSDGEEAEEADDGAVSTRKRKKRRISSVPSGEQLRLEFGGMVQYDLRFRPERYRYGTWYHDVPDPRMIARNEAIGRFKLKARYGRFGAVSNLDFVVRGYPKSDELSDLVEYNEVSPFRFEAHELYVFAQGGQFDLRVGQQKALFGVGDQFNPTNNINPNDLEDVLLFGEQLGNLMVRLDWTPRWNWTITGILVPVFKPSLLPDTGYLAQTPDRYPFVDAQTRHNFVVEQAIPGGGFSHLTVPLLGDLPAEQLLGGVFPTVVRNVRVQLPEFNAANMQQFFRVGANLGGQDIALSYYRGFSDIPQPVRNDTYLDADYILVEDQEKLQPRCFQPGDVGRTAAERIGPCVGGLIQNDVVLTYPRMQVLGFNMTGEFNAFGWLHRSFKSLGYRVEAAMVFPEKVRMDVVQHGVKLGPVKQDGPYRFPNGADGTVIDGRPFAKWVVGLDYTFNEHLYMNTQWVHGFPDEFGAGDWIQEGYTVRGSGLREGATFGDCVEITDMSGGRNVDGTRCAKEYLKPRIGDYLVVGLDIKFAAQRGLLRLFTIWDLVGVYESTWDPSTSERVMIHHGLFSKDGFSAVIYPDFRWNFGNGFELHAGALLQFGKPWTKFGAPENGGHQLWTRARYSF